MKLSDAPVLQSAVREELRNWGRWARDVDWLENNLMFKGSKMFDDYRPELGEIYDPPPARMPIDSLAAQEVERIIVMMGLVHFDAHQALIHRYPHRRTWEEIQEIKGWTPGKSKRLVEEGEQLYYEMKFRK